MTRGPEQIVLLSSSPSAEALVALLPPGHRGRTTVVSDAASLAAASTAGGLLVSFNTGVIVPPAVLRAFRAAYNIHAASPRYPGRDPHHFAAWDGAREYGATAHEMVARVDAGGIVAVELEPMPAGASPADYLAVGDRCGLRIASVLLPSLAEGKTPARTDVAWGSRKTTRADFLSLCRASPLDGESDFTRRLHAVTFPGRHNLVVDLHGQRFRHEGAAPEADVRAWAEFTEAGYAKLVDLARSRYRFADFTAPGDGRLVLWRHDIDMSVHRARALARIEAARSVRATYFFWLGSPFYSLAERRVQEVAREVLALGHWAGLHFDAELNAPAAGWDRASLETGIARQRAMLEELLGRSVGAVSFHNPEAVGLLGVGTPVIAGLVNAYSDDFKARYGYCSDSNGLWRFDPLEKVLRSDAHERLQVLTHPEWWTPEPLPPRRRVERCVAGRAASVMAEYDALLAKYNRPNVRE